MDIMMNQISFFRKRYDVLFFPIAKAILHPNALFFEIFLIFFRKYTVFFLFMW